MTAVERDAKRTKGCTTTGTFTARILGVVPHKQRLTPEMRERWIRLALRGEIPPGGGSLAAIYRSGPSVENLGPPQTDPALVAPHQEVAEIQGTLTSDGREPVRVPRGGAILAYSVEPPTLLRANRSSLPGGSTVYGLRQAYNRPDYRTDPIAGLPRPVPITERIGRLNDWQVTFYTHEAEAEFQENMLDVPWIIESPFFGAIHEVRLYEISEAEPLDTGLWDEVRPEGDGQRTVFQIERAAIVESGSLR